ncbi:MAG: hypothetical protein QM689_09050 [Oscillospiraceae bacterium]
MKKWKLYEWSVIVFFLVVPLCAAMIEMKVSSPDAAMADVIFKWFVFSGIGLRLGSAGIKQIFQPGFTAREIFGISDEKAGALVREIGCSNICFAVIALLSVHFGGFREPAAVCGGLYFGLAGLLHIFKRGKNADEKFAMVSDGFVFIVLLALMILVR